MAARKAFPKAVQVGCFDTSFHQGKAFVQDAYALPRSLYQQGIRRYGHHGLSYDYVSGAFRKIAPQMADGRVVIAHLGNGASMCALSGGRSVETTMGFSALDGLPMGTRCGQIDPGIVLYLLEVKRLDVEEIETILYKELGLKGISGLTNDMRDLEAAGTPRPRTPSPTSPASSGARSPAWRRRSAASTRWCSAAASPRIPSRSAAG